MIAIGGLHNANSVANCERYLVGSNKWSGLPRLNSDRFFSGSILPRSKRMFSFCRIRAYQEMNSVESLQYGVDSEWKRLPVNNEISKTAHLAASSF